MTDQQFANLPKYARDEWLTMERRIRELTVANVELKGDHSPEAPHIATNVHGRLNSILVPVTNTIAWEPDPQQYGKGLQIRYETFTEEWVVNSFGRRLNVMPMSVNSIRMSTRRG